MKLLEESVMQKIVTNLWFDTEAEAAARRNGSDGDVRA